MKKFFIVPVVALVLFIFVYNNALKDMDQRAAVQKAAAEKKAAETQKELDAQTAISRAAQEAQRRESDLKTAADEAARIAEKLAYRSACKRSVELQLRRL